ncbi:MAG: NB-ARC domain-containing protein [Anaerolineae bacterium]
MAHLFFSYAHKDLDRLNAIHARMEFLLERCLWIDRKELEDQVVWRDSIEAGIEGCDGVIFAVTQNFVDPERKFIHEQEIPWSYQHFKDKQGAHLFPVLLDDVELPELLKTPYITHLIDARDGDMERVYRELKAKIPRQRTGEYPFAVSWERLANFKGRDNLLIDLHEKLLGNGRVGVKTAGLHGTGGIGKTQLAVEYAYRYQTCYPGGVYWLNAAADWRKELAARADFLQLTPADSTDTDREKQLALAFFHHLKAQETDALVVLDNVHDPAEVNRREIAPGVKLADLREQTRARLLLTTRMQTMPAEFESVSVDVLSLPDARAVLLDAWVGSARTDQADNAVLDQIAQALGRLPLALGLASAALRKRSQLRPDKLLADLRTLGIDQIADKVGIEASEARVNVALKWQVEQLEQAEATRLLALLAAYGEAAVVPRERLRLLAGLEMDDYSDPFSDAVADLQAYHLVEDQTIDINLDDHDVQIAAFRLHPLTQQYAARELKASERLQEAAPNLTKAYRDPATLDAQVRGRGFSAVLDDLMTTQRLLPTPLPPPHPEGRLRTSDREGDVRWQAWSALNSLTRLLTLEEPHLRVLPDGVQDSYVIQQIRERAYHEGDDALSERCEQWLQDKGYLWHNGLRYQSSKALIRTLSGHQARVNGAIRLDDGRMLSWSDDGTLRLWSISGEALNALEGHSGAVIGALQLTNKNILSWSRDHTLRLWHLDGHSLKSLEGHRDEVIGALQLTGGNILSWSLDYTLRLWRFDGHPLNVLKGHTAEVVGTLQLSDGRLLSWASYHDSSLRIWGADGVSGPVLEGHSGRVLGAIQTKNNEILSWSEQGPLLLWEINGRAIGTLEQPPYGVSGLLELTNGQIVTWSAYSEVILIHNESFDTVLNLHCPSEGVNGVKELHDGRLLTWGRDKVLRLWAHDKSSFVVLEGHVGTVGGTEELSGGLIVSWVTDLFRTDNTLRIWASDGTQIDVLEGHTDTVIGVLEPSMNIILSWSTDSTLRLWTNAVHDVSNRKNHISKISGMLLLRSGYVLTWGDKSTTSLGIKQLFNADYDSKHLWLEHIKELSGALELQDGRILGWSKFDGTMYFWEKNGALDRTVRLHDIGISGAVELRNGRILSWSEFDSELGLSESDGTEIWLQALHVGQIRGALELTDGNILSWAYSSSEILLWRENGTPLKSLDDHSKEVIGVFQLKNNNILSWSSDTTLRLWTNGGEKLAILEGHTASVRGALGLADGRILSWSYDTTLRLWSSGGETLATLEGRIASVHGALELADGRILSWSDDGTLRLWSSTGEPLLVYAGDAPFTCCVVTRDGRTAVVGDTSGRVLFLRGL